MKDGRGSHAVEKSKANRAAIKDYIQSNPGAMRKDVCKAVGVTFKTLQGHLKALGIK